MSDFDEEFRLEIDFEVELEELDEEECPDEIEQLVAGVRGARASGA